MAKKVSPASLANLIPAKDGDIRNKYGRKGKDGLGGFSLKMHLKMMLNKMEPDERDGFIAGLLLKASSGDVAAFKLVLEMNDELTQVVAEDNGVRISIQMPPMEDNSAG